MSTDPEDVYASGSYDYVMGTGAVARQWARIHRQMERPYDDKRFARILEVGAGSGEHLPQVRSTYDEYVLTDLRADRLPDASALPTGVRCQAEDVQALSFADGRFDRVVVTCLLAHVPDPVTALSEIKRVVRPGGSVCIYLPCEPGLGLRMSRAMLTAPKFRRFGFEDPYFQHFQEHVHYFTALNHYLGRAFAGSRIRMRSYPLPGLSWNASLYKLYWVEV